MVLGLKKRNTLQEINSEAEDQTSDLEDREAKKPQSEQQKE